jgi:hypothetical protein
LPEAVGMTAKRLDAKERLLRSKFETAYQLIDLQVRGELPPRIKVFILTDDELTEIFTKKRLELLRVIRERHPASVRALAELVRRQVPAVQRDLSILKKYRLVRTVRHKHAMRPQIDQEAFIVPPLMPKRLAELTA